MEVFFEHILKSSVVLSLFLISYQVFLRKETFFTGNRLFLIGGLLTSFFLPFISIPKTIYVAPTPISAIAISQTETITTINEAAPPFNLIFFIFIIYLVGVVYFIIRLILQLTTIKKIKNKGVIIPEDKFFHVQTSTKVSPFSFFKHIFYHPKQYTLNELHAIISHEKVHARELHSLDILLTEIVCILLWVNPAIWFYKSIIKQNLEFLTDSKTCASGENKKQYQYLMLKEATNNHKINIVNPFFNSIIKKRIVMLNQNQSKRINLLKLLIILPFLGIFLVSFNTKEVVKFSKDATPVVVEYEQTPNFFSPLKQDDIITISSGFGPAKNPFTNKMANHTGIDLVAKSGKAVTASASGIIQKSDEDDTKGNYIIIKHADGFTTKYMHLKERSVNEGEKINTGEQVGLVGTTGKSTGPHLHFEILKSQTALNPASFIPFKGQLKSVNNVEKKLKLSKTAKTIELTIDKNTSDADLLKIKSDLLKEKIDFSYTTVRNTDGQIKALAVQVSGGDSLSGKYSSSYESKSDEEAISPTYILINPESNSISIGTIEIENIRGT